MHSMHSMVTNHWRTHKACFSLSSIQKLYSQWKLIIFEVLAWVGRTTDSFIWIRFWVCMWLLRTFLPQYLTHTQKVLAKTLRSAPDIFMAGLIFLLLTPCWHGWLLSDLSAGILKSTFAKHCSLRSVSVCFLFVLAPSVSAFLSHNWWIQFFSSIIWLQQFHFNERCRI